MVYKNAVPNKKTASKRAMIEEEELGDNVFPMSERALQNAIRFLHNQGTSEGVFRAAVIVTHYNCCGRANEVSYFLLSTTIYHADTGAPTTVWNEEKTGSRYFLTASVESCSNSSLPSRNRKMLIHF